MTRKKREDLMVTTREAEGNLVAYQSDDLHEKVALIAVNAVIFVGERVVLEWRSPAGSLRRAWAASAMEAATEDALDALDPYGDDLGIVVSDVHWSQAEVVEELHRMGVWRLQDLTANVLRDLYQGIADLAMRDALRRKEKAQA